jgi:anti-sigma B factor antagonist
MKIAKNKVADLLTLSVEGSINTQTSPEFEQAITSALKECPHLAIDLAKVDYVSSSGLRVFLGTENALGESGSLIIKNVPSCRSRSL